jgi:cytochrome c-type biogenesis protein CcmH/NrfG
MVSVKAFCNQRAVQAFENAISLNPDNASHRLNLALTYTEMPPEDNPMKGILLLRELQEQYPENTQVLNALGRLAIQTGQYARAVERLDAGAGRGCRQPKYNLLAGASS